MRDTRTDRAQTSGIVTSPVELCPLHPTFRATVRARRDVPEEKKNDKYTYTYNRGKAQHVHSG